MVYLQRARKTVWYVLNLNMAFNSNLLFDLQLKVKVWHIPEKGLEASLSNAECTFSHKQRRVETVGFHPAADCLLSSTSAGEIHLWDLLMQKEAFGKSEMNKIQFFLEFIFSVFFSK